LEQALFLGPGHVADVRSEPLGHDLSYDSFSIGPTR
jgi:hypothetical protein